MRMLFFSCLLSSLFLISCSETGSQGPLSLAGSDYGVDAAGNFKKISFKLVRKGDQVNSTYYTNGCSKLAPGGSCEVLVNYSGTGKFIGQSIGSVVPNFTTDVSACPKVGASAQDCKITLTHAAGKPIHTLVKVYVGRESRTLATFNTDVAVLPQTLGASVGISDLLNLAGAALGPVAADKIEAFLGISNGPTEAQFEQLSSEVSAIAVTVNQILNSVQQLTNIEILDFNKLEATIAGTALATELQDFNTSILSSQGTYALFESAIVNGTSGCFQPTPTPYFYPNEAGIAAAISAGKLGVSSAWGCSAASCSNLNQAYQEAAGLVVSAGAGLKGFDANVFQAINNKILADLKLQFSVKAFQKNNESVVLYAMLITSTLQKSYNMLHAALYLAQKANLPSFSRLIYPVSNPLMSPNFAYAKNKDALNQNFLDLGNQLLEDVEEAVMTDNPGDPTKLWTLNPVAAYSPKLIAAGLTAIPASNNWVAGCNIYEWAGATPLPVSYVPGTLTTTCVAGSQVTALAVPPAGTPTDYMGVLSGTQLSADCYYQGQANSSSINFSQCAAGSTSQAQINGTLSPKPYLQCSLLPDATNYSTGNPNCGSNPNDQTCFQGPSPPGRPWKFALVMYLPSPQILLNGSPELLDSFSSSGKVVPVQLLLGNAEIVQVSAQYWGGVNNNSPMLGQLQCLDSSFYTLPVSCQRLPSGNGLRLTTSSGLTTNLMIIQPFIDFSNNGIGYELESTALTP